ncbi:ABC transporter permease [candidate division KSB1 bacterium]|nr:ABC transporter permease [candidate division KSB1 bacterium]
MKAERFFLSLGEKAVSFFTTVTEISQLLVNAIRALPSVWFYRRQLLEQLYNFSVKTLPIAAVIAVFIGLGATVQGTYQTSEMIPRATVINVIFKSTVLELCPIVLSLVLAGKLGASLAAEIGSMKISEQIEALETMSLDPIGFLVLPRMLAGLIMLPVITIFANFIAIFSCFFVSVVVTDWISAQEFASGLEMDFKMFEMYFGNIIKPAVYGFIIALIGSFFGMRTSGGAKGVGTAATNAVVLSAVFIVIFDYYLGKLLL